MTKLNWDQRTPTQSENSPTSMANHHFVVVGSPGLPGLKTMATLTIFLSILQLVWEFSAVSVQYVYFSWDLWPIGVVSCFFAIHVCLLLAAVNVTNELPLAMLLLSVVHGTLTFAIAVFYLALAVFGGMCELEGWSQRSQTYPTTLCNPARDSGLSTLLVLHGPLAKDPPNTPGYHSFHALAMVGVVLTLVQSANTLVCSLYAVLINMNYYFEQRKSDRAHRSFGQYPHLSGVEMDQECRLVAVEKRHASDQSVVVCKGGNTLARADYWNTCSEARPPVYHV